MMSFQTWVTVFQIYVVLLLGFVDNVRAVYDQNPFLQGGSTDSNAPKDLNQFNLAVIVPPGKESFLTQPGDKPPSPAAPGYVWVQIPLANTPINENKPSTAKPLIPTTEPSVTLQPTNVIPTGTPPQKTTKEPLFTIEPPGILYGNDLNARCLQPRGQFPSTSCNSYINCWEGVAIEQTCPGGLLFNPAKLYCDYAANVDCQGKPVLTTPTPAVIPGYVTASNPTQTAASIPESAAPNPALRKLCLRSTGLFRGSTCNKFVNCWNDNAVEQDCPEGLYFSGEGYCDYPENVECAYQGEKEVPEKANGKNSECPLEFGAFRDRSNCSHYYSCAYYKVAARYECPEGFSFSDLLGLCDYSYRVDCSKEPQIFQRTIINNGLGNGIPFNAFAHPDLLKPADVGDNRCIVSYGLVRDRDNCSSYYVCEMGKVVSSYVCPDGYKFSNELGACDHEEKVNCNNPSRVYDLNGGSLEIPNIPKEILSQVVNCVPGSVFRLNPQCTRACNCRNGVAEIIQCTDGLAYDSKMDKCVPAYLARC